MSPGSSYRPEQVDPSVFRAASATIVGDVTLREEASVWFGAVLRGDTEAITVGRRTNIQDGAILHADPGFPCTLGDDVTVGHGAIVHGAVVEDGVLVGMRAVVMNGARLGAGSLIAAGCIVTEGTIIPPGSLVMGLPGKVVRPVSDAERAQIKHAAEHYVALSREYRERKLEE